MNNLSDIMFVWQAVFSWNYPQGVCGVWSVLAAMSDFFRHRVAAEKRGGLASFPTLDSSGQGLNQIIYST